MKRLAFAAMALGLASGLMACGDNIDESSGSGADGGGVDGDVATAGTCGAVLVGEDDLEEIVGAFVLFNRPDGSLIGTETVGVEGTASRSDCVGNTMITIVARTADDSGDDGFEDYEMVTFTHVNPGDTVYFRDREGDTIGFDKPFTDLNASLAQDVSGLDSAPTGVETHVVNERCDPGASHGFPANFLFDNDLPSCALSGQDDGDIDVLAYVTGPSPNIGNVLGYSFVKDLAYTRGTPSARTETAVTMPAWTAGGLDNAFVVSNVPGNASNASADLFQIVGGAVHARACLISPINLNGISCGLISAGDAVSSTTFRGLPEDFGEQSEGTAFWELNSGSRGGTDIDQYKNIAFRTGFTRSFFLDLNDALPTVAALVVSESTTLRPILQWFLDDSSTTDVGNFAILHARFWDGDGSFPDSDESVDWFVLTPDVAAGSVRFPEIPQNVAALLERFSFQVVPMQASIQDASWLVEWSQIVGPPGIDPEDWDQQTGVIDMLPQPEAGAERRFRRSTWQRDDD
ncbi:MAG: hypothetical protein KJO07_09565 [Deltaproteobacteria bacterium]|nr:hypothetical protein [Deltaproteobacteria bacterium]